MSAGERGRDPRLRDPGRGEHRSFGAKGYRISSAAELLPTLKSALADDTVSVIACPVDYTANAELIRTLGDLDDSLS